MRSANISIELTPQELEALLEVLIWLNDPELKDVAQRLDKSLGDWQRSHE